jgi:hypothetical protein
MPAVIQLCGDPQERLEQNQSRCTLPHVRKNKDEIQGSFPSLHAGNPKEHMADEYEPFLMRQRTPEELDDHDAGFIAGEDGKGNDDTKSFAWQRGWREAQE